MLMKHVILILPINVILIFRLEIVSVESKKHVLMDRPALVELVGVVM